MRGGDGVGGPDHVWLELANKAKPGTNTVEPPADPAVWPRHPAQVSPTQLQMARGVQGKGPSHNRALRVDYETQQRIPKDSALMYRDIIKANSLEPALARV